MFPIQSRPRLHFALTVVALTQFGCIATADQTAPATPVPQVTQVPHVEGRSDPLPPPVASKGSDVLALEQAEAAGNNAALILFLARFGDTPLADEARSRLRARKSPDPADVVAAVAGTDAGVVAAFDAARLGGRAALEAFIAAHGTHPLAAEARHWF